MSGYSSRPHEVHLRLSESEYRALEKNRAKCGLPQQTYLRKMCQEIQPREQPPADFYKTYRALDQIKQILADIARQADREGWMNTRYYWDNVRWLEEEIDFLRKQILYDEKG